jgi:hypothetical protein
VGDAVTYAIEAAVGAACLLAAVGTWRRPGLRVAAVLLTLGGVAAVVHAVVSLI